MAGLDQSADANPKLQCVCPGRHYLSHICKTCQITICSYCLKVGHEKHEVVVIDGINRNSQENLQDKLKLLSETCSSIAKIEHSSNQKFSQIIDEIIDELLSLKKNNEEKSVTVSQSQYKLVQSVMELVQRETNQKDLHPNKQYHILKMLECIKLPSEKQLISEGCGEEKIINLMNIKQIVQNLKEGNLAANLKSVGKQDMVQNLKEENFKAIFKNMDEIYDFKTNPIDLLQKSERMENIIAEKEFNGTQSKSNASCTFSLNGESFLAWTGFLMKEEKFSNYSLLIYNLSQMKRETNLSNENCNNAFSFVSIYPKTEEGEAFKKKILYAGDVEGVLRIYEVSAEAKLVFKLKTKLVTNAGTILSAAIFDDKFNELIKNDRINEIKKVRTNDFFWNFCYLMIATYNSSIFLYKNTENSINNDNWVLFRQIKSPINKTCFTMDYFQDERLNKTRFYFGFASEYIATYDLENNTWGKTEFLTKSRVTSMNFFVDKRSLENNNLQINQRYLIYYLIYTQESNEPLTVGNIDSGKIVRKADSQKLKAIYDCCIWNYGFRDNTLDKSAVKSIYLIAVCNNSIIVLDFDNLNVLLVKEFNEDPINVAKTWMKIENEDKKESYEGLVCIGQKIVHYENKV